MVLPGDLPGKNDAFKRKKLRFWRLRGWKWLPIDNLGVKCCRNFYFLNPSRVVPVNPLLYTKHLLKIENLCFWKNCSEICKNWCFSVWVKYYPNHVKGCALGVICDFIFKTDFFLIERILCDVQFLYILLKLMELHVFKTKVENCPY